MAPPAHPLDPDGAVARAFPGFEHRREQVAMADAVARTLDRGGALAVEAGTGTGKSFAYLIPAIAWSLEQGQPVIVATATIPLQEQLLRHDLPALAKCLPEPFRAALVKGRSNYACLRKAADVHAEPRLWAGDPETSELASILEWLEDTEEGSLSDLGFVPRPAAWRAIAAEHDDCLRSRCPDYDACFYYRARAEAEQANVVIVNHHLLLADRALRSRISADVGVLPDATRLIIDEAHHLEGVAADQFGIAITAGRVERALAGIESTRRSGRGALPGLLRRLETIADPADRTLADGAARTLLERVEPRLAGLVETANRAFAELDRLAARELRPGRPGGDERTLRVVPELLTRPFWPRATEILVELSAGLRGLLSAAAPVLERLAGLSEESADRLAFALARWRAALGRLGGIGEDLDRFLDVDATPLCRWFAWSSGPPRSFELRGTPTETGAILRAVVFESFDSVVLTSATLAVGRRFDDLTRRLGLEPHELDTHIFDSPFDFAEQALLGVPVDAPAPDRPGAEEAAHETILRVARASRGGAFVLFTSHRALTRAHEALVEPLEAEGLEVLRQGELARHALLERFRRSGHAVLFATDSFWEGVDVRGQALRTIVIARLPFRVPTEPVLEQRAEEIERSGGNAFVELQIPPAVVRLRQGFGRLIRTADDAGVVVVLDSRLATKRYGRVFLDSLPPARTILAPTDQVVAEVERFFKRYPPPRPDEAAPTGDELSVAPPPARGPRPPPRGAH